MGLDSLLLYHNSIKTNKIMKANMGSMDRIIRIVLAVVLAALYFSGVISGTLGTILVVVAAIFALTSLVSFCPLYLILGINTCDTKK